MRFENYRPYIIGVTLLPCSQYSLRFITATSAFSEQPEEIKTKHCISSIPLNTAPLIALDSVPHGITMLKLRAVMNR
jgi:hypothetical protein